MINMIVTLQVKPGMEAKAEDLLRHLETETTEHDKGCLRYQWYQAEHPGTYYLLERWFSQEALDAHFNAAHIAAALPQIAEIAVAFEGTKLTRLE